MGRNFIYKIAGAFIIIIAALFWVLSIALPENFGQFSLAWAGVVICFGIGIIFLVNGCIQQNITTIKKLKIWFGVGLLIAGLLCLVSALAIPENLVIPIIALVVACGFMVTILATGGQKWDEGDNHKIGYKNYFERKKEEQKKQDIEDKK